MSVFHHTFKFSTNEHGWVEQFFRESPSWDAALTAGLALAQARYSILGAGVTLWQVRITLPGYPRAWATGGLVGQTLPVPAMLPQVGAEISLSGGVSPTRTRSYFLRGLPQGAILNPLGPSRWAPAWSTAILVWLKMLTQGWLMRIRSPVGGALPLLGLGQFATDERDLYGDPLDPEDPPPGYSYVVAGTQGGQVPRVDTVHISGPVMAPNVKSVRDSVIGEQDVTAILGAQVVWAGDFAGGAYQNGGMLQPIRYSYVPITSAFLRRQGSRKVGPPTSPVPPPPPAAMQVVPGVPLPAPPVPLPIGPAAAPLPPVPPPYTTLQTARDLVALVYTSYVSSTNPAGDLVAIAPVVSQPLLFGPTPDPSMFLVLISGFDRMRSDNLTQLWATIGTQIGVADPLTPQVAQAIRENTPDGCGLLLAGDSMGGTSCQWMLNPLTNIGNRRVLNIVTFGSPNLVLINEAGIRVQNFANPLDPVPYLSPLGYWSWLRLYALIPLLGTGEILNFFANLGGASGHEYLDPFPLPDAMYTQHTQYDKVEALRRWNAMGFLDPNSGSAPLVIGPITRFPPTPP
jgi:hypothetical protein